LKPGPMESIAMMICSARGGGDARLCEVSVLCGAGGGLTVHAVTIRPMTADARPPFVLHDVTRATFNQVNAARSADAPLFVLKQVSSLVIENCAGLPNLHADDVTERTELPATLRPARRRMKIFVIGDSISIQRNAPHRAVNVGCDTAEILMVISPADTF